MSVFVDTGLFYALQNERAAAHDRATAAFEAVLTGSYGTVYTSDYVYDETVTLVRSRTGAFDEAKAVGDRILGRGAYPEAVEILLVDRDVFEAALGVFERYHDHGLSFTDATTIALIERRNIDTLLSFDDDFDGIVDRLDPTDSDIWNTGSQE